MCLATRTPNVKSGNYHSWSRFKISSGVSISVPNSSQCSSNPDRLLSCSVRWVIMNAQVKCVVCCIWVQELTLDRQHALKPNENGSCKLCFQPIPQAKLQQGFNCRKLFIPARNIHSEYLSIILVFAEWQGEDGLSAASRTWAWSSRSLDLVNPAGRTKSLALKQSHHPATMLLPAKLSATLSQRLYRTLTMGFQVGCATGYITPCSAVCCGMSSSCEEHKIMLS